MQPWEIYDFPYPENQVHPCIVVSNQAIIDNPAFGFVNCLVCTSIRPDSKLKGFHVRLNGADGLDNATVVRCNEIFRFAKAVAGRCRGKVSGYRKQAISRKLIEIFGLYGG